MGVDQVVLSGNALENVAQAIRTAALWTCAIRSWTGLRGLDWCSLKLVFTPLEGQWRLVGLIHSQWTI